MKQQITRLQWDELSEENKAKLKHEFGNELFSTDFRDNSFQLSIGQMIKYLGDDWLQRLQWLSKFEEGNKQQDIVQLYMPIGDEICNQLWEAVKYKLK